MKMKHDLSSSSLLIQKIKRLTSALPLIIILGVTALFSSEPSLSTTQFTSPLNALEFGKEVTAVTLNNWVYWQDYYGRSGGDILLGERTWEGNVYPKNGAMVIYTDGIVWGGKIGDDVRVGGVTYRSGLQPKLGKIYRVRTDIDDLPPVELKREIALLYGIPLEWVTDAQVQALLDAYLRDKEQWPVEAGAPWIDRNGDGEYQPNFDTPGIAQARQIIFYTVDDQDPTRTYGLYGSAPLGIAVKVTLWAYQNSASALGQVIFKRFQLKNISQDTIKEMYISLWSDPNIGGYWDDVVGCDSLLGVAFAYNGYDEDSLFSIRGMAPAAVGYDFVQGPIVPAPGEQAIVNFTKISDFKNLSMTAFCYWPSGGNVYYDDPDLGQYTGTIQWYNLMRGYMPVKTFDNPPPFRHATNGAITMFPVNGDPLLGNGEIDGVNNGYAPGARRMAATSGPFDMAPGDEQDIIIAIIGGRPGESRLDALADLKKTDEIVQQWADQLFETEIFDLPSPRVNVAELPSQIILSWGEDPDAIALVEQTPIRETATTSYQFEGYAIYQIDKLDSPTYEQLIATFDKINGVRTVYGKEFIPEYGEKITVPVFRGRDSGIERKLIINKDYLTDQPLISGKTYFYRFRTYFYNPTPQLLQDTVVYTEQLITAIPQAFPPGDAYPISPGTELPVQHIQGESDARVRVTVVNPAELTGHRYRIEFEFNEYSDTPYDFSWYIRDVNKGRLIRSHLPLAESLEYPDGAQVYLDGLEIVVENVKPNYTGFWVIANSDGPLPEPEPAAAPWVNFPVPRAPGDRQQVGAGKWLIASPPFVQNYSFDDFFRVTTAFAGGEGTILQGIRILTPDDYEIRFTEESSAFFPWSTQQLDSVPFQCWDIGNPDDPDDDIRLFPLIRDVEHVENQGVFNITNVDHPLSTVNNDPVTDWIYFIHPYDGYPGTKGYAQLLNYIRAHPDSAVSDSLWKYEKEGVAYPGMGALTLVNWNGGPVPDAEKPWQQYPYNQLLPEEGTIFRITTSNVIQLHDVFEFVVPEVIRGDVTLERAAVERVTVYPNPFLGDQVAMDGTLQNYVMFYHLPRKAVIRIFNLAGQHVVTLKKEDESQFLRWNLTNQAGKPVASGIYLALVEAYLSDGSVVKKTLKIFISSVHRSWLK